MLFECKNFIRIIEYLIMVLLRVTVPVTNAVPPNIVGIVIIILTGSHLPVAVFLSFTFDIKAKNRIFKIKYYIMINCLGIQRAK